MAKERCKKTTMDSFFGNFLSEQEVPEGHSKLTSFMNRLTTGNIYLYTGE